MRIRGAASLAVLALAGCPAPRAALRPPPVPLETGAHHDEFALAGVVHVVRRGETIWRIAKAYGIEPRDLMETNGIADPRTVEVGTELFIPGATREVEVPPAPGAEPTASSTPTGSSTATSTPTPTPTPASTSTSTPAPTPAPAPDPNPTPDRDDVHPEPPDGARGRPRAEADAAAPSPGAATPIRATTHGAPALAWPLKGVLYGRYGVRAGKRHDGIDIAAPEGTPVRAAAAGTVLYAGEQPGYGAIVILKHDGGLVTLYAHNARVLVAEGERVAQGEAIARVGQTGRTSGPHLHFEVREGTRPRNPLLFLP